MQSETDGSESGWSLVDGEGDLIDSDDFSVSDSEAAVHPLAAVESEWSASEREDEDGIERVHSEAEEEVVVEEDEEDLATDVDEIESIVDLNEEAEEIAVRTERTVQNEDEGLPSEKGEDIFHFAVDLRNERRVQIFAIGSVVAALLMALIFRGPFGVYDLQRDQIGYQQPANEFAFAQPSLPPIWTDSVAPQVGDLERCHQSLDVAKSASNSVLLRYMRLKNNRLESLLSELQTLVQAQKRELEGSQQKSEVVTPLQSASTSAALPCASGAPPPTPLPSEPTVTPSLLPDDRPEPQMCSKEPSFFNLTRSLFKQVVNFANTTALTAIAESRTDLVRLSSWLHKKTMKTLPKVVEQLGNVRSNWRLKFRSYLKKVGNALAAPLSGMTRSCTNGTPKVFENIKRGLKSAFHSLSNNRWGQAEQPEVCRNEWTCDHSSPFADHLDNSSIFRERLGKKQADSYVAYLRHLPPRQCTLNSTLMSCERCWWTGNCADVKKKCSPLRRWQRQKKIDPAAFLAGDEAARQILSKLGWITNLQKPCAPHSEPIGPPRSRKEERKAEEAKRRAQPQAPKKKEEDWLLQRGEKREQRRRAESASSWLFERHAHRRYLRQRGPLSNWLFARSSRRAALRNGGK